MLHNMELRQQRHFTASKSATTCRRQFNLYNVLPNSSNKKKIEAKLHRLSFIPRKLKHILRKIDEISMHCNEDWLQT